MPQLFAKRGTHDARRIDPALPYHVTAKTLRGEFLLRPDRSVNRTIIGVLAQARENWPEVKLYAVTVLSNHVHLKMRGEPKPFSAFVGFFLREVSRRLGMRFGEPGAYWHGRYSSTALPSAEAQQRCLKYIFSNSVKENLVDECRHWPGVQSATALTTGAPLKGVWFDGTGYGRAKRAGKKPKKSDYYIEKTLELDPLDCWSHMSPAEQRAKALEFVREVEHDAREQRRIEGKKVLGARAVRRIPRKTRVVPKPSPWFESRRRCICAWVDPRDPDVREFVTRYHEFQSKYREASEAWKRGRPPDFPPGSWAPARAIA